MQQMNEPMNLATDTAPRNAQWYPKKRPSFAYPGAKYNLAPKLCALMPRDCNRFIDLFAGRGNVTWAAMCDRTLHFEEFWLNDLLTFPFFAALLAADKFAVPRRSRELFNEMRWRGKHGFSALQQPWLLSPETWIYNVRETQRKKLGWDQIIVRGTPADGAVTNASSMGIAGVPVKIPGAVDIIRLLSEAYLLESYLSFSGGGYTKASMRGAEGRGGPSRDGYGQSLLAAQKLLQTRNAKITALDYHAVLDALRPGDFVFCDPPYVGANVRTYGWTLQQNIEFRDILLNDKLGCKWMLTEYPDPIYDPLTKNFGKPKKFHVRKSQSISHYTGGKRRPAIECVWGNY
jgi:hypothetical protein